MGALLLDDEGHVLELVGVGLDLAEVGVHFDLLSLLFLQAFQLFFDLLGLRSLLDLGEEVAHHVLEFLEGLVVEDRGLHKGFIGGVQGDSGVAVALQFEHDAGADYFDGFEEGLASFFILLDHLVAVADVVEGGGEDPHVLQVEGFHGHELDDFLEVANGLLELLFELEQLGVPIVTVNKQVQYDSAALY